MHECEPEERISVFLVLMVNLSSRLSDKRLREYSSCLEGPRACTAASSAY